MTAYGAELILVEGGMEGARDRALQMHAEGKGKVLDQFANGDNPLAHYSTDRPGNLAGDGWQRHPLRVAMGTTGTIMGVSHYLKEKNPPSESSVCSPRKARPFPVSATGRRSICRRFSMPRALIGSIRHAGRAEDMMRRLAREEGIFGGISAAARARWRCGFSAEVRNATIVFVVCDRGDRYLSTGVFPA